MTRHPPARRVGRVDLAVYRAAHRKAPRGVGTWVFAIDLGHGPPRRATYGPCTFAVALVNVRRYAQSLPRTPGVTSEIGLVLMP